MKIRRIIGIISLIIFIIIVFVAIDKYNESTTQGGGTYIVGYTADGQPILRTNPVITSYPERSWGELFMVIGVIGIIISFITILYPTSKQTLQNSQLSPSSTSAPLPPSLLPPEPQLAEEQNEVKFCPYCGINNPATFNFCDNCQKPLPERKVLKNG